MNKIKKFFAVIAAVVLVFTLASCKGKVEGSMTAETSRIDLSITFYAEFDNGSKFKTEGATAYVALYEGDTYLSTVNLTFTNDDYTSGESKFTKLTPGVEYTGKLQYTYKGEKNLVAEAKATIESTGDENAPIEIKTKNDFLAMGNDLNAHYVLMNDIDFTASENASSYDNVSIFSSSKIFKGTFDGNGYTIKEFGLTSNTYMGLFAYTENATIKNLNIENVMVDLSSNGRGETYMGAVVGKAVNTTIENVTVKNVNFKFKGYTTAKVSLGGFAGRVENTTITNCSAELITIEITHARLEMALGLFAGYVEGKSKVENCYAKGYLSAVVYFSTTTTTVDYVYAGGFVGVNDSSLPIKNCYTVAEMKVTEDPSKGTNSETHRLSVGGFVGGNLLGSLKLENCLAVVDLDVTTKYSNRAYVGGLTGKVIHNSSSFKNCAYEAKNLGVKVNCKLENVVASVLFAYCETTKIEDVYAYTTGINVPEGFTPVEVTPITPDQNLENLKTTINYQ